VKPIDSLSMRRAAGGALLIAVALGANAQPARTSAAAPAAPPVIATVPGMPGVPNPANLYSEATAGKLSAAVEGALPRVYVPNLQSNDVYVIDPATLKVVDRFRVGLNPQHVVPSCQLDQRLAILGPDTGGVDHRQASGSEPLARNELQHFERSARRALIVLVIGDETTAIVG